MPGYISNKTWDRYKKTINKASETFNQMVVIWKRSIGGLDRFGEDNKTERFEFIKLKGLTNYNENRVWPVTIYTETGELDKQSEVIIFNMNYLRKLGYLNENGNFMFEPSTDRIIHKGITWKCSGATDISQAPDESLLCQLILQKELIQSEKPTN